MITKTHRTKSNLFAWTEQKDYLSFNLMKWWNSDIFSEWSAIEKEMGDGLQSAGHHMDT